MTRTVNLTLLTDNTHEKKINKISGKVHFGNIFKIIYILNFY